MTPISFIRLQRVNYGDYGENYWASNNIECGQLLEVKREQTQCEL